MDLAQQILDLTARISGNQEIVSKFRERALQGNLTRDEDNQSHVCVHFLAYDSSDKKVFLGHHKKANLWIFSGGHVDKGEVLEETVVREVWEEWSQKLLVNKVGSPVLLTITDIDNYPVQTCTKHYDVWYLFKVKKELFEIDNNKIFKEFHQIGWKSIGEARSLVTNPANLTALDLVENL
jgi:8-oxo-dGTP pyrophosphatase MutT (NUDIX family)